MKLIPKLVLTDGQLSMSTRNTEKYEPRPISETSQGSKENRLRESKRHKCNELTSHSMKNKEREC